VYEQTNFKTDSYNEAVYNGSDKINIWRATAWFAGWHKLFDQRLRLYYSAYIQPGLSDTDNYRSQIEAGLDFPVWKGLNFSVMYNYTHENVVVSGIKQNDGLLTFGISYQLKK
jgi:hypothetical protein